MFTSAQALRAGFTRDAVAYRRSTGRWLTLYRGIYAIAGAPTSWEQDVVAAVLAFGSRAAASSLTAGALWALIEERPRVVHVILPLEQHRHERANVVLHRAALTRSDVRTLHAIPVTAPNRTLVDLAAILQQPRLEAAFDTAVLQGLTSLRSLDRYIFERRLEHRSGVGIVQRLIEDRTKGVNESELERVFLRNLRAAKLPEPTRQYRVGRRRIDIAYPRERVIIELDGLGSRFSRAAFRADRNRQNEIVLALPGWTLLRFTRDDVILDWAGVEETLRTVVG
jgi:very-short-patch-repair endonuclease